jgi:hypothetical protein
MRRLVALLALCLSYASSLHAAGIVLDTGIDAFQVDQSAPAELLQKLAPLLDAAGTEELRVAAVIAPPEMANLLERWQSPRTIGLVQFIRGREVRPSWVSIRFDVPTHEVTLLGANFLPDRGLNHKPRLTAAQARAKAQAQLRDPREPLAFDETSARLAYDSEQLAWVFLAKRLDTYEPYEVSVSSATGKVIRLRGRWIGCFGEPPGDWVDVPVNTATGRD